MIEKVCVSDYEAQFGPKAGTEEQGKVLYEAIGDLYEFVSSERNVAEAALVINPNL